MKTGIQKTVLLIIWCMSSFAHAFDYQDSAQVIKVEPIIETRNEPVTRRVCTEPDDASREFNEVAATIGEDIRYQARQWKQQFRCRPVVEQRARERITGYRVTYRYGGEIETTRLSYDPGDRMPVKVSLSPSMFDWMR